jgi:hypothetical protein
MDAPVESSAIRNAPTHWEAYTMMALYGLSVLVPVVSFFTMASPTYEPFIFPAAMVGIILTILIGETKLIEKNSIIRVIVALMTTMMMVVLMLLTLEYKTEIKADEMYEGWNPLSFAISAVLVFYALCGIVTSPILPTKQAIPETVKKIAQVASMAAATVLAVLVSILYVSAKFLTTNG